MKIAAVLLLLNLSLISFAQKVPSTSEVLKIISKINHQVSEDGETELIINEKEPFKYINEKFMAFPTTECMVIVPAISQNWRPSDYIIHFSKADTSSKWRNDYAYISNHLPFCGDIADTIDINPLDGMKELSVHYSNLNRGRYGENFKIISLKSGKEKILYSYHSILLPVDDEYAKKFSLGDTIFSLKSYVLSDINNDKIKEILETTKVGRLFEKNKNRKNEDWNIWVNHDEYLTIYYYKNDTFYPSKPILMFSKTREYNGYTDE